MEQIKLLLVDDETEFVKTLSERLKMRELDSEIALNGEEALEIVGKEPPDVMVLDLKMPGVTGIDILGEIKKVSEDMPVIILSGSIGIERYVEDLKRLGYNSEDVLYKPIDLNVLLEEIKKKIGPAK